MRLKAKAKSPFWIEFEDLHNRIQNFCCRVKVDLIQIEIMEGENQMPRT